MKAQTVYITVTEVQELQDRLINSFGGLPGTSDHHLLESIVFLPHSGTEDKMIRHLNYENIFDQAAVLLHGFVHANCFKNSNRAIAVFASLTFLKMNGIVLGVSSEDLLNFVLDQVIAKKMEVKPIGRWLESHRAS